MLVAENFLFLILIFNTFKAKFYSFLKNKINSVGDYIKTNEKTKPSIFLYANCTNSIGSTSR